MCWSARVSATFAAAEWAGIAWLVRRNEFFDRRFALAISPIAGQEALQWLLWEHIALSSASCDRVNVVGSLAIRQMTNVVPLGLVWFAQRGSFKKRLARVLLLATITFVVLRSAMISYSFYAGPTLCTTIGPGHHQAWAPYLGYYERLQPILDVVFFSLYWMLPVASLLLLFQPRWFAVAVCLICLTTMVPCLWMYSADEVGSVWCWCCSMLIGLGLLRPRLDAMGPFAMRAGST